MPSARFRHRITLRRYSNVPDGKGGYTRSWSTLHADLPAEVVSLSGREAIIANALQGISNFRITTRYVAGIQENDQVLYDGRELNIHNAEDPTGRRKELVIVCSTEAPQGA
jgi:SPP1 family predicted phage head-tail adaptor